MKYITKYLSIRHWKHSSICWTFIFQRDKSSLHLLKFLKGFTYTEPNLEILSNLFIFKFKFFAKYLREGEKCERIIIIYPFQKWLRFTFFDTSKPISNIPIRKLFIAITSHKFMIRSQEWYNSEERLISVMIFKNNFRIWSEIDSYVHWMLNITRKIPKKRAISFVLFQEKSKKQKK